MSAAARRAWPCVAAVLVLGALAGCRAASAAPRAAVAPAPFACDGASLAALRLDGAHVVAATAVPAGAFTPPGATPALAALPAFCRVQAVATPTSDSHVTFEVWVPAGAAWNGKLVVTGNGGFSPTPSWGDMADALRRGYATVGGDTGHQTADPNDLRFGVGHPERIVDWGTRSVHAITVPARRIVAGLRGREASRAYFVGCSTGGHQAYAELQRYPGDFDGVVAGAPGNDRVRLTAGFLWQFVANRDRADPVTPILPAAKLPMITAAVVAACDTLDGVRDGVVDDPRRCAFDPATLRCAGADAASCLTDRQLAALGRLYAGARSARTGTQVYPGWPVGTEAGWAAYWGTSAPARVDFWRLWVFDDAQWDPFTFDFDRDMARADRMVGRLIDQTNPDLAAFRRRRGKAIVYQGWQDPVVNAFDTIAYYDSVRARQGSQEATDGFFRLFLVPGMRHCAGGPGATNFGNQGAPPPIVDADHDLLAALDRWVEQDVPPDAIVASRVVRGTVTRTRRLCPYPRRPVLATTAGDTDDAANFVCR